MHPGGHKDNRNSPEARVLTNQSCELKTIKVRHADIDEDQRKLGLWSMRPSISLGARVVAQRGSRK
jgi:hypothetical protein